MGEGNVFTRVCHSLHREESAIQGVLLSKRGGGLLSRGLATTPCPGRQPPPSSSWATTLPSGSGRQPPAIPPQVRILRDTVNQRSVRILQDCFLVVTDFYRRSWSPPPPPWIRYRSQDTGPEDLPPDSPWIRYRFSTGNGQTTMTRFYLRQLTPVNPSVQLHVIIEPSCSHCPLPRYSQPMHACS